MWFLIKGTFYCTVTLVALSFLAAPPHEEEDGGSRLEIGDAFTAATGAYEYVASLCVERPEVCEKGMETFQAIGQRAREGALVAYQILDKQFTDTEETESATADARPLSAPETDKGVVEIVKPKVTPAVAAAEFEEPITTGTVVPSARPRNLPQPYRKPSQTP